MSVVYVISDVHFGHRNICNYRPMFNSMQEHDETIMENILMTVKKRDTLWMLGDCFFEEHTIDYAKRIAERVQSFNFIPGNHDTDKTERVNIFKNLMQLGLFDKVGSMFHSSGFWLTHAPIHPQELYGRISLHGHVHRKTVPDNRFINVSAENINFTPVNLQQLKDENYRQSLLVHYGDYTHDCKDFLHKSGKHCLVCDAKF